MEFRDQLQAALGDAYVIERELGGGGMSRVFVAEETSVQRRVVVKVLPIELTVGVSIARFRREVLLAASLHHPHIVPLIAAGEVDGMPYYTMPFVDGESLRVKLARGAMPIAEAISVLRDVAEALEFAHGKGVAHRDIKPDNVILAGRSAMIIDFGVAKALNDATSGGALTSIGIALGTPAYMAPEQAAADPSTDFRADYYAFGAMAFEMLAGHVPFAGRSGQAMLAAHAIERPPPIAALRSAIPPGLADLVMRCLEKRASDRPQSATEIMLSLDAIGGSNGGAWPRIATRSAISSSVGKPNHRLLVGGGIVVIALCTALWGGLRRVRTASVNDGEIRSIAVLPFENKSGDTTFDYLEDGITDNVRDALNAMPTLTVKARGSSRKLKGRDAREVGAMLGVAAVLQGSLSRSTSHLHITAELVRASDDVALWSATFDGTPSGLVGMQDTIVRAVAEKFGVARAGEPARLHDARGTANTDAYDSFLRGRYAFDRFDLDRADEHFRDAVARDPHFARAQAYLAMSYATSPILGVGSLDSSLAIAQATAERALALDSTVVEAYVAESFILSSQMRLTEALRPLERALSIDSTSGEVLWTYGASLAQVGRVREGVVQLRRARQRDPLSVTAIGTLGYVLGVDRQYDAGIAATRAALDLAPGNTLGYRQLGFLYAFAGKRDSILAPFEAAFKLSAVDFGGRSNLVFAYAAMGRWDDAKRQRALGEHEHGGNSPNYYRLISDLSFGEYDAAMTDLERGVAKSEALLSSIAVPCDPLFDPLKSNPRFDVLMRKIGAQACPASGTWPIGRPR